ncbi:MAG TPA: outer membrane protein transport protein [Pseudolabrys sp.]|nr:outer membrane protein transport protein [Pseudolabrys sp.]
MFKKGGMKALLLGCSSIGLVLTATVAAQAGGFALREQSAYGQGTSFAGIAAGGALSSMFWNPATMTQFGGLTVEGSMSAILPYAKHKNAAGTEVVNNSGEAAVVPSSYISYQFSDRLWLGMAVNAPFGLGVNFPSPWGGTGNFYAQDTNAATYNFNPNIAYKLTDWLSVAVGFQAQYMWVNFQNAQGLNGPNLTLNGTGWGYGFTAGVTITPTASTTIGIGYRSALNNKIDGTLSGGIGASTNGAINTTVNLPDILTIGLRQGITDRLTVMAGYEWSNWSRIGTPRILQSSGAAALGPTAAPITLPFQYEDGHFYSIGAEYKLDPAWTIRAGLGFEKSPITDRERTPRLPDNDRTWYSAGLSWKPAFMPGLNLDLGYSYIDVKNTPINVVAGNGWFNGLAPYVGSVDTHIHIISVGARYQFGVKEPARVKQAYLK